MIESAKSSTTVASSGRGSVTSMNYSCDHAGPSSSALVSHRLSYQSHRASNTSRRLPISVNRPRKRECRRVPLSASSVGESSDSSEDASCVITTSQKPASFVSWQELARVEPQLSGALDPFGTFPSRFSPDVVDMSEKYCSFSILISLLPPRSSLIYHLEYHVLPSLCGVI